jgi:hypothetical protein
MNRLATILILLFLAGGALSAQSTAVIKELSGKVELQAPQADWVPARVGMTVSRGTTISTGFNSRALLDLGSSVLNVRPLTRLRLEELLEREGTVQTELYLRVGKVRAEVKSIAGTEQNFTLRSPVSTAAVRGTKFEYNGFDVLVTEGNVVYLTLLGQGRSYSSGEGGGSDGYQTPASGGDTKDSSSSVNPYTPGAGGESGSRLPADSGLDLTGSVTVFVPPID